MADDFDDTDDVFGETPKTREAAWKPHRPFGVTQAAWKKQLAEGRKRRERELAERLGLPPLEDHGK